MDDLNATESLVIRGMECQYDPDRRIALIPCENCGHYNPVEIALDGGEPMCMGFVCMSCGYYNSPE